MKKVVKISGLIGVFVLGSVLTYAQTVNPMVSKDVQRFANKQKLEESEFRRTEVQAKTGNSKN